MDPDIIVYQPEVDTKHRILILQEALHNYSNWVIMDLLANGCEVRIIFNGEIALQEILANKIDLVISGVMLKKVSGYDVLDIVRNTPETKDIKFIVSTGLTNDKDISKAKELDCTEYIDIKSTPDNELLKKLHHHLGIKEKAAD